MLEKLGEKNKEALKSMMQSIQEEQNQSSQNRKERCYKSSKLKPQLPDNSDEEMKQNQTNNNNGNNVKIKKSSKMEPVLQKKVKGAEENLNTDSMDVNDRLKKISKLINEEFANAEGDHEEQLRKLLEKSLQKKKMLESEQSVEKQVNIQGSFEQYDIPARIIDGKISMEIDNKYFLKCTVEWKPRPNGIQPIKSFYDNAELRKFCPQLLLDFYESKILPKQEIEQQLQLFQSSVGKKNELKEINNVIDVKQKYEGKQEIKRGKEIDVESVISISSEGEPRHHDEKNNGEQILIQSEKPMTIETLSSGAEFQRKKLLLQINQEEDENEKQRKKIMEVIKQKEDRQQQLQSRQVIQPETDLDKYKKQLIEQMQQQEIVSEQENSKEQSSIRQIPNPQQQQNDNVSENDSFSNMKLYLQKVMEQQCYQYFYLIFYYQKHLTMKIKKLNLNQIVKQLIINQQNLIAIVFSHFNLCQFRL